MSGVTGEWGNMDSKKHGFLGNVVTMEEIKQVKSAPYMTENIERLLHFGKNQNSSILENVPRKLTSSKV